MLALIVAGIVITFNLIPALNIGLVDITSVKTGFWIILCRLVGVFLIIFPIWVSYNVIKEGI